MFRAAVRSKLLLSSYTCNTHVQHTHKLFSTSVTPEYNFQNKCAFVTGGTRGIGFTCVQKYLDAQGSVILCGTSQESVTRALDKLSEQYPHIPVTFGDTLPGTSTSDTATTSTTPYTPYIHGVVCDVSNTEDVTRVFQTVSKFPLPPNILVNSAGICYESLLLRSDMNAIERMFQVNVLGTIGTTKAFLRYCRGISEYYRIINISSIVSHGSAGLSGYSASKAAVHGFTASISKEITSIKGKPVTCNTISPGYIHTDMTDTLTEVQKNRILDRIPSKTMGTPQDIANTVLFLTSTQAKYINGQNIEVNGGMTI